MLTRSKTLGISHKIVVRCLMREAACHRCSQWQKWGKMPVALKRDLAGAQYGWLEVAGVRSSLLKLPISQLQMVP